MASQNTSRVRMEQLRIASIDEPGFHADADYVPHAGESVHTTEGAAKVVRVLNRITGGGRLLELRLEARPSPPFFAASDNVLVKDDVG